MCFARTKGVDRKPASLYARNLLKKHMRNHSCKAATTLRSRRTSAYIHISGSDIWKQKIYV